MMSCLRGPGEEILPGAPVHMADARAQHCIAPHLHGHQGGHETGYGPILHGPQKWRLGHRATAPDVLLRSSHVLALPRPLVWKCSWCRAVTGVLTAMQPYGEKRAASHPHGAIKSLIWENTGPWR